jgi:hypothetical protein
VFEAPQRISLVESAVLAFSALLLVLTDAPQTQLLRAADAGQEANAALLVEMPATLWGSYPVSGRDSRSVERMARHITPLHLVRVRTLDGTFIGHIGGVRSAGLVSLAPDTTRSWTGPTDLLSWDDIRTIEVRRRSPLRTAGVVAAAGAIVGVVGGLTYAKVQGTEDLATMFVLGLAGVVVGGPIGLAYGSAVPIWEPLYRAP